MSNFLRWMGAAALALTVTAAPAHAQESDDGAALLDEALSVMTADSDSSFEELLSAVGDEKVTMEADGVSVTLSGEALEVSSSDDFLFGSTTYKSYGSMKGQVLNQSGDGGETNGIIIIEEMGIIVIYWNNYVIILY